MSNQEIAELFRKVAASYSIKDDKKYYFQIVAYTKAAEIIEFLTTELKDLYKEGKLDSVPGVGATIKSRLEELFKKGSVKHFDEILKGIPEAVFVLMKIPSIGPKRAYKLAKELNLNDPTTATEDLLAKAQKHEVAKIPTFGEKSEEDIIRALSEFKEGRIKAVRMLLPFASEIADKIIAYLRQSESIQKAVPLGSLRRMMPTIGDVDIAITTNNPNDAIRHFVNYPYKLRVIEQGPTSASIITSGNKQIDIKVQPKDDFGALLQHFTGSKSHNVHLREYSLKKGLSLSEKGIKDLKTGRLVKFDTEEKFYGALGMDWIPPEMREDRGEIELAIEHKIPDLIEISDVKGDLHVHSDFPIEPSHDLGKTSIQSMVELAEKLNYEYIGFSEHNPSVSKHTDDDIYKVIEKRNQHIEHIQEGTKNVRIIKMLEIDILGNGSLAIDNRSLDLLDGAIVSIHTSFAMNKEDMTKRVLAGLSHPKAKILAHPTGRKINERLGYELDFDKIFDFCKKSNKAIEINSWPNRLDIPDQIILEAVRSGVKMIINTDSHNVNQMSLMRYGVAMARRGWAKKSDIINTLSYKDFVAWLKS